MNNCSVLPKKKRHQFLTVLKEKPPDIGLNSFFFFFETISTFGSKIFPCSKECHNPIMLCTGKKSLSSIYLKSGICYLFLAVLNFLYCETAIKNKVEEKSCNIRQINQNHLKLSFEAFSILTCKELLHTFTQTRSCCCWVGTFNCNF